MWETLIVLFIVAIAIIYLARRFFNKKRVSCGCGGCGSSPTAPVTHSCCMCDEEKDKK